MWKQLSGHQLSEALKGDAFGSMVDLFAMARSDPDDANSILLGQDCQNWVAFPISGISEADYLGDYSCPDGTVYPFFHLYLTASADSGAGLAFAKLLKAALRANQTLRRRLSRSSSCSCKAGAPKSGSVAVVCTGTCKDGYQASAEGFGDNARDAIDNADGKIDLICASHGGVQSYDSCS
jgi:hypothetical protein